MKPGDIVTCSESEAVVLGEDGGEGEGPRFHGGGQQAVPVVYCYPDVLQISVFVGQSSGEKLRVDRPVPRHREIQSRAVRRIEPGHDEGKHVHGVEYLEPQVIGVPQAVAVRRSEYGGKRPFQAYRGQVAGKVGRGAGPVEEAFEEGGVETYGIAAGLQFRYGQKVSGLVDAMIVLKEYVPYLQLAAQASVSALLDEALRIHADRCPAFLVQIEIRLFEIGLGEVESELHDPVSGFGLL